MNRGLTGSRILVVEDEAIVAWALEDMLAKLDCKVVGPAARVSEALGMIETEGIDAAMLDVNLNGEKSYPVADALTARGLPFIFCTGYGKKTLQEPYLETPMLQKPFDGLDLGKALAKLLEPGSSETSEKPPMRDGTDALTGVRVLVVEDVGVLAMLAEAHLVSFGCEIAGEAATAVKALDIIKDAKIHVALLDIRLREGTSFGVADALAKKGVPYVFVTAHGRDKLPDEHSGAPLLQKPYGRVELRSAILQGLGREIADRHGVFQRSGHDPRWNGEATVPPS